eukprot:694666-Pleurochrysis_carterae.AAC.2
MLRHAALLPQPGSHGRRPIMQRSPARRVCTCFRLDCRRHHRLLARSVSKRALVPKAKPRTCAVRRTIGAQTALPTQQRRPTIPCMHTEEDLGRQNNVRAPAPHQLAPCEQSICSAEGEQAACKKSVPEPLQRRCTH